MNFFLPFMFFTIFWWPSYILVNKLLINDYLVKVRLNSYKLLCFPRNPFPISPNLTRYSRSGPGPVESLAFTLLSEAVWRPSDPSWPGPWETIRRATYPWSVPNATASCLLGEPVQTAPAAAASHCPNRLITFPNGHQRTATRGEGVNERLTASVRWCGGKLRGK